MSTVVCTTNRYTYTSGTVLLREIGPPETGDSFHYEVNPPPVRSVLMGQTSVE